MLDASGVLIDLRQVPEADWRDGVNTVALKQKPDLALGRYRFERANNSFGYKFVAVSKIPAAENQSEMSPVLPALVRAVLDLAGRGSIAAEDLKTLREYAQSIDGMRRIEIKTPYRSGLPGEA